MPRNNEPVSDLEHGRVLQSVSPQGTDTINFFDPIVTDLPLVEGIVRMVESIVSIFRIVEIIAS